MAMRLLHPLPAGVVADAAARRLRRAGLCAAAAHPHAGAELLYSVVPSLNHSWPGHPESAERVPACLDELVARSFTADTRLVELPAHVASTAQLELVHSRSYLQSLNLLTKLRAPCEFDASPTYLTKSTLEDASLAVGAALALVDAVVEESRRRESGTGPSGFALVRPPGHHALPGGGMGFCLLSTAAIAARHAQKVHGLARVLVVDFDVHHCNGTEAAFEADETVMVVSSHQAGSFPGTGLLRDVGTGPGAGFSVNVPLPGGSGDAAARAYFESVVAPLAERFKPDIILVSAGYDAHWRDPLAGLNWRNGTYHHLSKELRSLAARLCGGRLVFLLEGGYDLTGLSGGVADSFAALMGAPPGEADPAEAALRTADEPSVAALLREVRAIHSL